MSQTNSAEIQSIPDVNTRNSTVYHGYAQNTHAIQRKLSVHTSTELEISTYPLSKQHLISDRIAFAVSGDPLLLSHAIYRTRITAEPIPHDEKAFMEQLTGNIIVVHTFRV